MLIMTNVVRVGDTVNLAVASAPGGFTTAKVLKVTDQDTVDVEYYNPHRVVVEDATRATKLPAAADEFVKVF